MLNLFTIAQAAGDVVSPTSLAGIVQQLGIPVALVCFFVWRNYRREERITAKQDRTEEYVRSVLGALIQDNTRAMNGSASALRTFAAELSKRPCVVPDEVRKAVDQAIRTARPAPAGNGLGLDEAPA